MSTEREAEIIIIKTVYNNGEQACQNGYVVAFRNIMELAHNICLSQVDTIGRFNSKTNSLNGLLIE